VLILRHKSEKKYFILNVIFNKKNQNSQQQKIRVYTKEIFYSRWDLKKKIKIHFDLQNESTWQNSTGQYKAEQHMTNIYDIKQILSCMIFDRKFFIWVIRTKSCPIVQWGTRISDFVQSLDPQFVQYQWQFSNQT
jgi:hypothetical protein